MLHRRAERLADAVTRGHVSRETETRLRFIRRLIYAVILLIGVAIALSQFAGVDEIAASLLASGVVAAAIIGFAARQTLANFVAGVMLAITQPIRVGDWVTFEGQHGVVEDVRLNYTFLRTAGETRLVIPNEKLASGILLNDTLKVDEIGLEVAVWIPPAADAEHARRGAARGVGRRRRGRRGRALGRAARGRRRPGARAGPRRGRGGAARTVPCTPARGGPAGGFRGPGPKLRGDYTGWFAPSRRPCPL